VNPELQKLVALQQSDTKIRNLQNAIKSEPNRRASLEQEFEKRAFQIRELQRTRDEARAAKLNLETQIADVNSNLERAERNLKQAQNQKQYEAAVREKSALEKQVSDLETKLLESDEAFEAAEKSLNERADEIASLDAERADSLQNFETETVHHQTELDVEQKHRTRLFAELPKNYASVYDRLVKRIRDGIAVAEVRNGACSACFMSLRPQLLMEIKMGDKILTCESCNRILYHAPKEEPQTA
jgi:uncharacterized protein